MDEREKEKVYWLEKLNFDKTQQNIIQDNHYITIGNRPRGTGKSYTLMGKIIIERPKSCLYLSFYGTENFKDEFGKLLPLIKSDLHSYNTKRVDKFEYVELKWKNGDISTVMLGYVGLLNELKSTHFDIILFDDILPMLDLKADKMISMVTVNHSLVDLLGYRKDVRVFNCGMKDFLKTHPKRFNIEDIITNRKSFIREFDIMNDLNEEYFELKQQNINIQEWLDEKIESLTREFDKLNGDSKNTLHRKDLITMISKLVDMKEN